MKKVLVFVFVITMGFGQWALAYDDAMISRHAEIVCSQVEVNERYTVALVKSDSSVTGFDLYVVASGAIAENPGADTKVFEGPASVDQKFDQFYIQDVTGVVRLAVGYLEGKLSIKPVQGLHGVENSFMLCFRNRSLFFHEPKSPSPRISIGN